MFRILTTFLLVFILNAAIAQDFAVQFNGSNTTIAPDSSKVEIVNGSAIVFSLWVNTDWTTNNFYVFDWSDSLDYKQSNDNMRFNLRGIRTGVARFGFYFNSASPTKVEANLSAYNNAWTNIVCTLTPKSIGSVTSTYLQSIYVNGVLLDSTTATVAAINTGNNSIHINKGSHFRIGSRYGEDTLTFYSGAIDNFQVSKNTLNNNDLKTLACDKNTILPQSILFYAFDEGNGSTSIDSSASKAAGGIKKGSWVLGATNPNNLTPISSFTDTSDSPSLAAKFTNTSQNASSYKWTFGDGDSSSSVNVYNSFPYPDTFRVCLESQNECGKIGNKFCKEVIIICPEPDIKLKSSVVDKKAIFNVDTASNYYLYAWDFGDKSWSRSGADLSEVFYEFPKNGTYTVCAAVRSTCGRDTFCREVVVGPTGFGYSANLGEVSVYPNPFSTNFTIDNSTGKVINYEVVNAMGETVLFNSEANKTKLIDTESWKSGVYFLRVTFDENSVVHSVIKR